MRDMKFKALPSENAKPMGLGVAMKLAANVSDNFPLRISWSVLLGFILFYFLLDAIDV